MKVKIPSSLVIGGITFRISFVEKIQNGKDKCFGLTKSGKQTILIAKNYSQERTMQTFLHEVLHAIDGEYAGFSLTEAQVCTLSAGLAQVFKDMGVEIARG